MLQQLAFGGPLQPGGRTPFAPGRPLQEEPRQDQEILPALAQGGDLQFEGAQALGQLRRQGDLRVEPCHPAQPRPGGAIHGPGQGPRCLRRQVFQTRQVQASALEQLKGVDVRALGAQGGRGHTQKGRRRMAQRVEAAGAAALAGAALPAEKHRQRSGGGPSQGAVQSLHGGAVGDPGFRGIRRRRAHQGPQAIQQGQKGVQVEGFGQEVVGPEPHGLHDVLGFPEGGHEDHAQPGLKPARPPDQLQPAHARQPQVRHQHMGRRRFQGPQRLLRIRHRPHRPRRPLKRLGQQAPEAVLVLDEQKVHGLNGSSG